MTVVENDGLYHIGLSQEERIDSILIVGLRGCSADGVSTYFMTEAGRTPCIFTAYNRYPD